MLVLRLLDQVETLLGPEVRHEAEQIVVRGIELETGTRLRRSDLFTKKFDLDFIQLEKKCIEFARRRKKGETLQYILGTQAFFDLELEVGPGVLVPRPETELLVEKAAELQMHPNCGIEIGLGSGAISIELLRRFPGLKMVGSEVSPVAISYTQKNSTQAGVADRLEVRQVKRSADVFEIFEGLTFVDFIISNPPYLSPDDLIAAEVLENEPKEALFASGGTNHFYEKIAKEGPRFLKKGGAVYLEIPDQRAGQIKSLFLSTVWNVEILNDLTGKPRILIANYHGS